MKVTCLALEPGGALRQEAEATAVATWRGGGGPYWIDLGGGTPEEVRAWLAGLGLDSSLLDLIRIGDDETRILPLAEAVFVDYPVPPDAETGRPARFCLLSLARLIVTMHEQTLQATLLEKLLATGTRLREGTTAGVVCALVVIHSSRLRREAVALRREGDGLADRMDEDPGAVTLKEILDLKHRAMVLGGVVDEELSVLHVLKISDRPTLPLDRLAEPFQIAIETTRATDRDLDRLERRMGDLQHRHEAAQQDVMNRRIALLTVISAIFMPLTLIVGIYGMNFDVMPELHLRYGYPAVLGVMALVGGGLYRYFRSRWFPK